MGWEGGGKDCGYPAGTIFIVTVYDSQPFSRCSAHGDPMDDISGEICPDTEKRPAGEADSGAAMGRKATSIVH